MQAAATAGDKLCVVVIIIVVRPSDPEDAAAVLTGSIYLHVILAAADMHKSLSSELPYILRTVR